MQLCIVITTIKNKNTEKNQSQTNLEIKFELINKLIRIMLARTLIHLSKMAYSTKSSFATFAKSSKKIVGAGINYKYVKIVL